MNHKVIAKRLTELKKTSRDSNLDAMSFEQDQPDKIFFRFVDKNPLFLDNTKGAIQNYILSTHKIRCTYKPHRDESHESLTDYLTACRLHDGNK